MSYSRIQETVHRSYTSKPKYSEIMSGVPEDYKQIRTLGDLLNICYKHVTVQEQMRSNLIAKLKKGEHPFPGIIGYNDDVVPAINRAILSGHDMLLVGQIGQAKTKIAEAIAQNLLSPIPIVRGTITSDIPIVIPEDELIALLNDTEISRTKPEFMVSPECEDIIRANKLETKIDWVSGADRYKYILSTPDISVKDLVGQIDAIKIAKKGVELYNIESYSAGQLLQARHGILCIDELPVLDPRKQVSLLSVLQEGKFTTGAYPVYFEPDLKIIATSNPIDYTHSGKIIEPLFDRLRSHIDTHYPTNIVDEMLIILQEAQISQDRAVLLPIFIIKTIAKVTQLSRQHPEIDHTKGVSVRMAIHSTEVLASEVERIRSIHSNMISVPRFSDFFCIYQSCKFELSEIDDTRQSRNRILDSIIESAIREVSTDYTQNLPSDQLMRIKEDFKSNELYVASQQNLGRGQNSSMDYISQLEKFPSLSKLVTQTTDRIKQEHLDFIHLAASFDIDVKSVQLIDDKDGEFTASVTELILEGLRWTNPPLLDKKGSLYSARLE